MKTVILITDVLDSQYESYEVENICDFLQSKYTVWPETARIYHKEVSFATDVTPAIESDIDRLLSLEGPFFVVVYPSGPVAGLALWQIILINIAVSVALSAVMQMFVKEPATPTQRNIRNESPNNGLSDRTNQVRINSRIPDIYGTVRSVPDLLAVPYKVFKDHEEVEYSYMCIGRGEYEIPLEEIKDDTTRIQDIPGTSVEIYSPGTSPNSGDSPILSIGDPINTPVYNIKRLNTVNGQVLRAANDGYIVGISDIKFIFPNIIKLSPESIFDFTQKFIAGDQLVVYNSAVSEGYITETRTITPDSLGTIRFSIPSSTLPSQYQSGKEITITGATVNSVANGVFDLSGIYHIQSVALETETVLSTTYYYCKITLVSPAYINPKWSLADASTDTTTAALKVLSGVELYNLNGTYTILSVSTDTITLSSPSSVNSNWSTLTETVYFSPTLMTVGEKWVGPFIIDNPDNAKLICNFVALNGLYKDNGYAQLAMDVVCELEVQPIDSDDIPYGTPETFQATVVGSSVFRGSRAITLEATPTFAGRCQVRARRVTPYDLTFAGQVVDEIKWRDIYSVEEIDVTEFGNVTTVQSVTYATAGSLAVKDRKLNMQVTRKIPLRNGLSSFTTGLYATNSADEIISAICLDPYIGNRQISELDIGNIYSTLNEVRGYFDVDSCATFNYTFDSNNLSFEETIKIVADAVFCVPYRQGNILKLSFEKETEDSTLLFNHRNKLPGTEVRTVRFGNADNFDGVSYKYIDPKDDSQVTYYIPADRSAINPKEFESAGVRNKLQAHFHAWRLWNKIKYQNTVVEFTGTQECDLLVTNDRILVTDGTRSGSQDGEVESQSALTLTLSQDADLSLPGAYTIFLQLYDGTVDNISITAGPQPNQVILARAPLLPLALDADLYARTTYMIAHEDNSRITAFLVAEKQSQNNFTSTVKAINYSQKYYENDLDYRNGIVGIDGNLI